MTVKIGDEAAAAAAAARAVSPPPPSDTGSADVSPEARAAAVAAAALAGAPEAAAGGSGAAASAAGVGGGDRVEPSPETRQLYKTVVKQLQGNSALGNRTVLLTPARVALPYIIGVVVLLGIIAAAATLPFWGPLLLPALGITTAAALATAGSVFTGIAIGGCAVGGTLLLLTILLAIAQVKKHDRAGDCIRSQESVEDDANEVFGGGGAGGGGGGGGDAAAAAPVSDPRGTLGDDQRLVRDL